MRVGERTIVSGLNGAVCGEMWWTLSRRGDNLPRHSNRERSLAHPPPFTHTSLTGTRHNRSKLDEGFAIHLNQLIYLAGAVQLPPSFYRLHRRERACVARVDGSLERAATLWLCVPLCMCIHLFEQLPPFLLVFGACVGTNPWTPCSGEERHTTVHSSCVAHAAPRRAASCGCDEFRSRFTLLSCWCIVSPEQASATSKEVGTCEGGPRGHGCNGDGTSRRDLSVRWGQGGCITHT